MSRTVRHRTTARVLLERGPTDQAAWWTADALDADGSAANDQLTTMMRAAISVVLGEA